ncbi:tetratricopeptide repeat protein [Spongiivirga citrea]|uniref:Tetratricopeptide repeat protein n=1 Tax=Spongiivirga citrea TaxID=1481457 RepID=A0A6M0CM97_9FLAO|nr:hypothetical protein [Spongiivirga citrea]NER19066.1 hypothetical protein [Spongiivirga citrea]
MKKDKLIEKYLQNTLNTEERIEFDTLLQNDAEFKEEVSFHDNLKRVTEEDHDDEFRSMLSDFEAEHQPRKVFKLQQYSKWLVAASVILIAGLTYVLTLSNPTSQELFAANFQPYENVVHPIVRGTEEQDQKTKAFIAYETGDYKLAVSLFSDLYEKDKQPYYLFYKANALLKLEKANEAIPLLKEHLKTRDTLKEKSAWYLALAYLKIDDKKSAQLLLEDIIKSKKYKASEAEKLLGKFEKD